MKNKEEREKIDVNSGHFVPWQRTRVARIEINDIQIRYNEIFYKLRLRLQAEGYLCLRPRYQDISRHNFSIDFETKTN